MSAGSRFVNPYATATTPAGEPVPGALLNFYITQSSTLATTYADAALTTPNPNPVTADANGVFPAIFLDPTVTYKSVGTYPPQGTNPPVLIPDLCADPAETVPESSQAVPSILTGDEGAAQIGSSTGTNVEERLGVLDTEVASLTATTTAVKAAIPLAGYSCLRIATLGASNYTSVITANAVILQSTTAGAPGFLASAVNVSPAINVSGANGLDGGTATASTWYYVFVIYDPTTAATAGLFSLSSTAPTLPSGYTFFARVGAVLTLASGYLMPTLQTKDRVQNVTTPTALPTLPVLGSGASGNVNTPTYTAIAVAAFVPPTAIAIRLVLSTYGPSSTQALVAPNANYGGNTSTTNLPPMVVNAAPTLTTTSMNDEMTLESTNIYWASSGSGNNLQCFGWVDNL